MPLTDRSPATYDFPPPRAAFEPRAFAEALWQQRRRSALVVAVAALVGVVVSLLLPVRYQASTTLSPAPSSSDRGALGGALASLGGQLGVDLAGGGRTQLRFYPTLIGSQWFLENLARSPVAGDTTVFQVLMDAPLPAANEPSREMDAAIARLRRLVDVALDDRANTFSLTLRMPRRDLSLATMRRMVALVSEFDTQVRRLRATENRKFIEERARAAQASLSQSEDALSDFLSRNRSYEQSPELRLAYARLERRTALLQDVYTTLARNLEQARVDEVKEAPVLTVVDPPHVTWRKVEPQRPRVVALFVLLGVALSGALVLFPELQWPRRRA